MEAQAGARPPCIVFWVAPPLGDGERLIRNTLAACAAPPAHRIVLFTGALYQPQPHEVVLAMGQPMVAAMAAAGLVPKKRTIGSLRGRLHPASSAATVPLSPSAWSPRSRLRSPSLPPSPPPSSLSSSPPPSSPSLSSSIPPSSPSRSSLAPSVSPAAPCGPGDPVNLLI